MQPFYLFGRTKSYFGIRGKSLLTVDFYFPVYFSKLVTGLEIYSFKEFNLSFSFSCFYKFKVSNLILSLEKEEEPPFIYASVKLCLIRYYDGPGESESFLLVTFFKNLSRSIPNADDPPFVL